MTSQYPPDQPPYPPQYQPHQQPYPPAPNGPAHSARPDRHEGMAITALVLGVIGVVFGCIPITFVIAFICGLLAFIFGLIAHRPKKGKAGAILGAIAIILGVIGVVIVAGAFDDASKTLNCVSTADTNDQVNNC